MSTKQKIKNYIYQQGKAQPKTLSRVFKLHPTMIHRHLKSLLEKQAIEKIGSAPLVFYTPAKTKTIKTPPIKNPQTAKIIQNNFIYLTPQGKIKSGTEAFTLWLKSTNQLNQFNSLANEFAKYRQKADQFLKKGGFVDATFKLKATFKNTAIDQLFYLDFYSLPKFGKTRLGKLTLHAKSAQNKKLINQIALEARAAIQAIINQQQITAVAFIPHSIPRKTPFLKEFSQDLNLSLPKIKLSKAYTGEILVAQKSLSRLSERIENAKNTIFVNDHQLNYTNALLIDDAVGSGSTLNETAKKLKKLGVKKVYGFAVVGSFKGFEVISEL